MQQKHNLRRNTAVENKFWFINKKKHSFFADSKLQNDQINKKNEANSISNYLFKNQLFWKSKRP